MNQLCRLLHLAAISLQFRRPHWPPKCSDDFAPTPRRWDQHQRSRAAFPASSAPAGISEHTEARN